MTPLEFIKKWKPVSLTERAAAHTHFLDLCKLFDHPDPVSADPSGEWFTFEKGATKTGGGEGFADVWKRSFFAWEYKKKKRNLDVAMDQLVRYAAALENPPLQVVCDTDRFIIRTAWTNKVPKEYEIELDDLADPDKRKLLWAVFHDPDQLQPKQSRASVTREAADKFSTIAARLQNRGTPEQIAHFVNQLVFCFFANSVKLLPEGFFPRLLKRAAEDASRTQHYFDQLFTAMEGPDGEFGLDKIAWFNGGLFDGSRALAMESGDVGLLIAAGTLDWSLIDPTIFGTLFERFLDPEKRSQIGAHYTDPDKIMMIVEPVILRPLRAEWATAKAEITGLLNGKLKPPEIEISATGGMQAGKRLGQKRKLKPVEAAEAVRSRFLERLRTLSILDPACGSGNFLYLALQGVKDIELKADLESEALGLPPRLPIVGPEILHGIEINSLAAELARTTIWIGDIQWRIRNGIYASPRPILRKLDSIECRDALVAEQPDGTFTAAKWPLAEFIIGNPPFLGSKFFRKGRPAGKNKPATAGLGDAYTELLQSTYNGSVPGSADFCVYWFAKCKAALAAKTTSAFGLVATKAIAKGTNNLVLQELVSSSEFKIFSAWTNEEWVVDGAEVRVALVCVGHSSKTEDITLNDTPVVLINSDLSKGLNFVSAKPIPENASIAFQGVKLNGPFEVEDRLAMEMLSEPTNVNGLTNSIVLKRFVQNDDVTERPRVAWIVDFSDYPTKETAAKFQKPFEFLKTRVLPFRAGLAKSAATETENLSSFWMMQRPRPMLRKAIKNLSRCILVPETSEHRLFVWGDTKAVFSGSLFVIARDDDVSFGVLCSRFHDAWSTAQGNRLGTGNQRRYNATRTFETFPFPKGLTPDISANEYQSDPRAQIIANAAQHLNELRNLWLNPPELIDVKPEAVAGYPDRMLPKNAHAASMLKSRTMTNLYNQRPQWLVDAHQVLDSAVAAAYGWPIDITDEKAMENLLNLNLEISDAEKART